MRSSLLLCLLCFLTFQAFSQVVVNKKGTVVTIDSSKWSLSGTNIYNKNSGNVGIGNPSPNYKLDIIGKLRVSDSLLTNSVRIASLNSGTKNDSIVVADPVTGILKRIDANRIASTINNGLTKLVDSVQLGGILTKATTITQGSNKLIFTSSATDGFSVDGTTFSIDGSNNRVGIGTSAPASSLEVNSGVTNTSGLRLSNLSSTSPTNVGTRIGVNATGDVINVPTTVVYTSSVASATNTTRVNVSGLLFLITNGKKYRVQIIGSYQSASTTVGGILGFILPSGSGTIVGKAEGEIASSKTTGLGIATGLRVTLKVINSLSTTIGSFLQTSAVNPVNEPHYIGADFIFTCTGSGSLQVVWASSTTGTTQLNAGSTMIVDEL
jgi:hypothetical protein